MFNWSSRFIPSPVWTSYFRTGLRSDLSGIHHSSSLKSEQTLPHFHRKYMFAKGYGHDDLLFGIHSRRLTHREITQVGLTLLDGYDVTTHFGIFILAYWLSRLTNLRDVQIERGGRQTGHDLQNDTEMINWWMYDSYSNTELWWLWQYFDLLLRTTHIHCSALATMDLNVHMLTASEFSLLTSKLHRQRWRPRQPTWRFRLQIWEPTWSLCTCHGPRIRLVESIGRVWRITTRNHRQIRCGVRLTSPTLRQVQWFQKHLSMPRLESLPSKMGFTTSTGSSTANIASFSLKI